MSFLGAVAVVMHVHEAVVGPLVPLFVGRPPAVRRIGDAVLLGAVGPHRTAVRVRVGHRRVQTVHIRPPLLEAKRSEVVVEAPILHHHQDNGVDSLGQKLWCELGGQRRWRAVVVIAGCLSAASGGQGGAQGSAQPLERRPSVDRKS